MIETDERGPTNREPGRAARRAASRWLVALARPVRGTLAIAIGAPLLAGAFLVCQAWLLSSVLHRAIAQGVPPSAVLPDICLIAGLMILRALLTASGEAAAGEAAESVKRDLRLRLGCAMLDRPATWTAARPSGALASALVEGVEALGGFFARYVPALASATILPLAFAVAVMPADLFAGMLLLATAPLIPVFMALVGWGAEAASRHHQHALLKLSGLFADRLRGLVTLRLFGQAEAEADRLRRTSEDLRRRTLSVLRIAFVSSAVLEFFAALGVAGIALYVGLTYLGFINLRHSPLTLELGLFCLFMAPEAYLPLRQFAAHYHDRAAAMASVAELTGLFGSLPLGGSKMSWPGPESDVPRPSRSRRGATSVRATALSVTTPDGHHPVIEDSCFAIAPGSHAALLGPSGSGKSTLLEVLAGLREHEGDLELDGLPSGEMPDRDRRSAVAVLCQRPHLFHDTIAGNIRLGRPGASARDVREAASLAGVMRFADALPLGLETMVGDGGVGLSGGEIHRVALARVFLRDPGLVLLDEPTAHLDPDTEAAVLDGILCFAADRTMILATHSPSVAARMDRTLRIAGGRVLAAPRRRAPGLDDHRKGAA
jgi:ATP-binding cassette subfamily C protein CydD